MSAWDFRWALTALAVAACTTPGGNLQGTLAPAECEVSASDLSWLDTSLAAFREAAFGLGADIRLDRTEIFVFDADCLIAIAPGGERSFTAHDGMVPLPIGTTPARITSVAAPSRDPGAAYFVMALPSIWEKAGFESEIGLHDFTLGVFAHEISHVWQLPTYFRSIKSVVGIDKLPIPVNDDIVQRIYAGDENFRAGVEAEIKAFSQAARQEDPKTVRALARRARDGMRQRWGAHFIGDRAALSGVQAIFLTLEGSGQWFALRVLITSPSGPGLNAETAHRAFGQRGGKWSQDLGLALMAVLDRLGSIRAGQQLSTAPAISPCLIC